MRRLLFSYFHIQAYAVAEDLWVSPFTVFAQGVAKSESKYFRYILNFFLLLQHFFFGLIVKSVLFFFSQFY